MNGLSSWSNLRWSFIIIEDYYQHGLKQISIWMVSLLIVSHYNSGILVQVHEVYIM